MEYKFSDIVDINPRESLSKGTVARKIGLQDIPEYSRHIASYSYEPYKGGTKFRNGDTLFVRISPSLENGKTAQVTLLEKNELAFGSTEYYVLRAKEDIVLSDYIYFLSRWDYVVDMAIKSMTGTTGRQRVRQSVFDQININLPNLPEQEKVVDILNAYDKKIETNNKIIANLEAQAQAIFKYYFVYFEPFRDGKFIDSDLGPIPEGWEIVELSDVADFRNGYSFKSKELDDKKTESNDYKVFKMGDISVGGGFNLGKTRSWISKEFIEEKNISRYIIDYGDLLMCMTDMKDNVRLLGHVAFNWFDDEYILNQRVGRITSKSKEITNEYLYFLINSDKFIQELRGRANRGVQVNLSTKEIKASKLLVPNTPYLDKYNKFISKIMKYNGYLTKQNQTLAQTRDALLPKLMAGEIDLEGLGGVCD